MKHAQMCRLLLYLHLVAGVLLLSGTAVQAQKTDYNQVIAPDKDSNYITYTEKLVQVAWRNFPLNRLTQARFKEAVELHKQANLSWFNNLSVSGQFYSQTNLAGDAAQSSTSFIPRAGLGLTLNVGSILQTPSRIRAAREEVKVTQANIDLQKLFVRGETLRRYNNYLLKIKLLKVQTEAVEDSRGTTILLRHKFETGEIDVEEYNKGLRSFTDNSERKITTEQGIIEAKLTLEELLGVPLEQIK